MRALKILSLILSLGLSLPALADSVDGNFQANASLNPTCTIFVVNSLPFVFTPSTSTGFVYASRPSIIRCSSTLAYTISMSAGKSGNISDRTMTSSTSSDVIHYNIYTDSTYSNIFGDGTTGVSLSKVGTGISLAVNYYGRLDSNQFVTPGSYSDTLTYILTY